MARGAGQDRFLGSLMGMAIGDAMGMPVAGIISAWNVATRKGAAATAMGAAKRNERRSMA